MVHYDLNPSNVIITRDYRNRPEVKIVDFGFARLQRTFAGGVSGTHPEPFAPSQNAYASPEQRAVSTLTLVRMSTVVRHTF